MNPQRSDRAALRRPFTISAAILASFCGSAAAQCQWSIFSVPDFDQRRFTLPNNGEMYCAPTSALNWFAYLANHGIPQPMTLGGPRDWQSDDNYTLVTDMLTLMGTLMGTDPQKGTRGGTGPGAKAYAALFANGDIIVAASSFWGEGDAPSASVFNSANALGAYIQTAYGYYSNSQGGTRSGGHVISVNGMLNCTGPYPPVLIFRDPAFESSPNNTQGHFRGSLASMTPVVGIFKNKSDGAPIPAALVRLDPGDPSNCFLDSFYLYLPASALLTPPGSDANELRVVRPIRPDDNPMPEIQSFNKAPGTGPIVDVAIAPDHLSYYYACDVGTPEKPNVWRLDAVTGVSTKALNNPFAPSAIALSRFKDLYTIEANKVVRYSLKNQPAGPIAEASFSQTPEGIAYDDATDRVVVVTAKPPIGLRKVHAIGRTLPSFSAIYDLNVSLTGKASIVPDPDDDDAFWVCADETSVIYRVNYSALSNQLEPTDTIFHVNASIGGLNLSDSKTLVYTLNDALVEKVKNAQGQWVNKPGSRWTGRPSSTRINLGRSRDNYKPSTMDFDSFNNLPLAQIPEFPSFKDACYADCDDDGILTINDFICFQTKFAVGDLAADCDLDGLRTIDDFICFQTLFAIGC